MPKDELLSECTRNKIALLNYWLKVGIIAALLIIVGWKFIITPIDFDFSKFDFSDLLSLILAVFSISIAVVFYFKATDTSNLFYDNTYKFTQEISKILGRIEAGFGERLKHLDERYSEVSSYLKITPNAISLAEEIKKEKEVIEKTQAEKDELIDNLVKKANIQDQEKIELIKILRKKDNELFEAKKQLESSERVMIESEYCQDKFTHNTAKLRFYQICERLSMHSLFKRSICVDNDSIIFKDTHNLMSIMKSIYPSNTTIPFINDGIKFGFFTKDFHLTPKGMRCFSYFIREQQGSCDECFSEREL